ncbi:MAG TPA: response regulator transcription factor [Armatimonadota bacterium]|jgi:two-component system response regulator NreC|nr:response regulator transcription factor [Armatimonadota bacterium]HOM82347.1 response regulator transcription factor [Armatimonadota bacterium]HPO72019.1 response regulator transcription factor [Armatimonadota bacterium]HPT97646.1 response regulator transcription factor [Armatimonadota bacterium]
MSDKIRLLLADDHAILRSGLRLLLSEQPDMEVVGEAADGEEAIEKTRELNPDILLLDITMPGVGGLEVLERIKKECPQVRVVVLTMHDDESYMERVMASGGSGYVLKKAADTELISAIRAVHQGGVYLHPSMTRALVNQLQRRSAAQERQSRLESKLSEREREVLKLIAEGYTNKEIADMIFLSVKTVETHKAHIMDKLELRSRAELVRYALDNGLLKP